MPTTNGQLYFGTISLAGTIAPDAPTVTPSKVYNEGLDQWDVDLDYTWVENGATVVSAEYSTDGGATWLAAPAPGSYTGNVSLVYTTPHTGDFAVRLKGTVNDGKAGLGPLPIPELPVPVTPTITTVTPTFSTASIDYTFPTGGLSTVVDVEFRLNGGAWSSVDSFSNGGSSGSASIVGLTSSTNYDVELRLVGTYRPGEASNMANFTTGATPLATGGTVNDDGGYRYHTFTATDTLEFSIGGEVEYVIIGGGGGGGQAAGTSPPRGAGGGGAGGVLQGTTTVAVGSYPIVVGSGGGSVTSGSDSSFNGLTAIGGGAGGSSPGYTGAAGGSGGGAGAATSTTGSGGAGTPGQGYAGGASNGNAEAGGGGGAAGNGATGGGGGGAISLTFGPTTTGSFAGGGGGGGNTPGGGGGGGAGSGTYNGSGSSAGANTGSGGGGGGNYSQSTTRGGGSGGSGRVIVRYPI